MKYICTLLIAVVFSNYTFAQGDNCFNAVTLGVTANCSSPTAGSTSGLTPSLPGCTGNADDDGWYKFVATNTSHSITVIGSSYDAVLEVLSGNCTTLSFTTIACSDAYFSGQAESALVSGLTIGNTYFIRVFDYATGSGSGSGNFNICLTNPPPPPTNNNCSSPINLIVGTSCSSTAGTTYGATQSLLGCTGVADDDVWFTFTANSYTQNITVSGSSSFDGVVELYEGNCSSLKTLNCIDNTFSGQTETVNAFGLNPGQTYYVRVYDYYNGTGSNFNICVTGNNIGTTQPNDNPCSALQFPPITSDCNYSTFSTNGATNTGSGLAPAPVSCTGGSGGSAGFSSGTSDVWFKITVPANGALYITPQPNQGSGFILDGSMALYSGSSCSALTQIACSSDNTGYPGAANDVLPYIAQTGLTPGSTVYLRYWKFGTTSGNFGLCIQAPTNDACANALYICDINGYSASTSGAYTPDRPGSGAGQMYGNNETAAGVNQTNGVNTCGPFGFYPSCPATAPGVFSSPALDVNIENNSWIRFTAATSTVSLRVTISDCWVGNYPSGGIQMQIFSATGCNNFVPKSSFREGSNTFTITATALIANTDYYLMVDGFANDICNYTIQALTGVAYPAIKATPDSVCAGQTVILTAPPGATSYEWYPGGQTTQTISINPFTTQIHSCIVGGICGYKQTLAKTVKVIAKPIITTSTVTICSGKTATISATGATSYTWSTGATTSTISQTPLSTTNYTVRGTAASGCTNTAVGQIIVSPTPTITLASQTICNGSSQTLNASGANTYNWSTGQTGSSISVSPTLTTVYTVTGTAVSTCSNVNTATVTVLPRPQMTGTPTIMSSSCVGSTGSITGVNITGTGTLIYTWTNGSSVTVGTSPNLTGQPAGTYYLLVTNGNGCLRLFGPYNITNPGAPAAPTASTSTSVICEGNAINLFASGATGVTYNWSGPNGFSSSISNPSIPSATTLMSGLYSVYTTSAGCSGPATNVSVTVNPLPTALPSSSKPTYCPGETINLFAGSATSYTWTGPSGFTSNAQNPTIPNASASTSGIYTLSVSNAQGCNATSTLNVVTYNASVVSATTSSNTICVLGSFTLNATGGSTYAWTGPNGFASSSQSPSISNAVVGATGIYTVVITSSLGCSVTQTVAVNVVPNTLLANAIASTYYGNAPLTVNFTNASLGVTTTDNFNWTFGNGSTSTLINPNTVYEAGTYSVTLMVTDVESGCMDDTTLVIKVEGDLIIIIPNVFTPNNDGVNDVFSIKMTGAKEAQGNIYNRWGQLLYSWDALNTSWDGKALNGTDCPDATYFYLITVIDNKDKKHEFEGHVTIVR